MPIADRAKGFAMLLRMVREAAAPALVHPGEHRYSVPSLAPFEAPPCAGLTRRPVLLGKERTERLLKQLEAVCSLRVEQQVQPRGPRPSHNAHSGWAEHFVPQHAPDRVLEWAKWGGSMTSYVALARKQAREKARRKARLGASGQVQGPSGPHVQRRRLDTIGGEK